MNIIRVLICSLFVIVTNYATNAEKGMLKFYLFQEFNFERDKWLLIGNSGGFISFRASQFGVKIPKYKYYSIENSSDLRYARALLKGVECAPILETTYDAFITLYKNGKRVNRYFLSLQSPYCILTFYDTKAKKYRGIELSYKTFDFLKYSNSINEFDYEEMIKK